MRHKIHSHDDSDNDHHGNGLITDIWGGPTWVSNFAIAFGYPLHPTDEQKQWYKNHFMSLAHVLPCRYCRDSYGMIIKTGDTELTDAVMESRGSLTRWFFKVREVVNRKLGVDYMIDYEDVIDKYESFRARCQTDSNNKSHVDYKTISFKKAHIVECPVISIEIIKPFFRLACLRKLDKKYFRFIKFVSSFRRPFSSLKKHPIWEKRNIFCKRHIEYMQEHNLPSVESSGIWVGTPTINELILMMFMCTRLNHVKLNECMQKVCLHPVYFEHLCEKKKLT